MKTNKYIEFALFNIWNNFEATDLIFQSIKYGAKGISLAPSLLYLAELIPPGINISAHIDYPFGLELSSVRQHSILSALNRGAKSIDLVCPHFLLLNKKTEKFDEDIKSALQICRDKNATLRVMIDYRLVPQTKDIDFLCQTLKKIGVDYVFPSTGHFVDEFIDNLIISAHISTYHNLDVILNGNAYLDDHFRSFNDSEVFGIRFTNLTSLKRYGVVSKEEIGPSNIQEYQEDDNNA